MAGEYLEDGISSLPLFRSTIKVMNSQSLKRSPNDSAPRKAKQLPIRDVFRA